MREVEDGRGLQNKPKTVQKNEQEDCNSASAQPSITTPKSRRFHIYSGPRKNARAWAYPALLLRQSNRQNRSFNAGCNLQESRLLLHANERVIANWPAVPKDQDFSQLSLNNFGCSQDRLPKMSAMSMILHIVHELADSENRTSTRSQGRLTSHPCGSPSLFTTPAKTPLQFAEMPPFAMELSLKHMQNSKLQHVWNYIRV